MKESKSTTIYALFRYNEKKISRWKKKNQWEKKLNEDSPKKLKTSSNLSSVISQARKKNIFSKKYVGAKNHRMCITLKKWKKYCKKINQCTTSVQLLFEI